MKNSCGRCTPRFQLCNKNITGDFVSLWVVLKVIIALELTVHLFQLLLALLWFSQICQAFLDLGQLPLPFL